MCIWVFEVHLFFSIHFASFPSLISFKSFLKKMLCSTPHSEMCHTSNDHQTAKVCANDFSASAIFSSSTIILFMFLLVHLVPCLMVVITVIYLFFSLTGLSFPTVLHSSWICRYIIETFCSNFFQCFGEGPGAPFSSLKTPLWSLIWQYLPFSVRHLLTFLLSCCLHSRFCQPFFVAIL